MITPMSYLSDQMHNALLYSYLRQDDLAQHAPRPYPWKYVRTWTTKNGAKVLIRPIRPEDEPLMVKFHATLSDQSVYNRYFHFIKLSQRVAHERLQHICCIDYDREMVLVVDHKDCTTGEEKILAVGRLMKCGMNGAEFAIVVSDQWQNQGLGSELLRRLLQIGRAEKVARIVADILPDNFDMQRVCRKLGFEVEFDLNGHVMKAKIDL
jgi:acetyltransferase